MKLFIKILLFVLVALAVNAGVTNVAKPAIRVLDVTAKVGSLIPVGEAGVAAEVLGVVGESLLSRGVSEGMAGVAA
jgi:hypothetical protein